MGSFILISPLSCSAYHRNNGEEFCHDSLPISSSIKTFYFMIVFFHFDRFFASLCVKNESLVFYYYYYYHRFMTDTDKIVVS